MTLPTAAPGQCIEMTAVPNLRDVGGYETRDGGRVRRGRLYRSTELDKLAGDDVATFERLGIRTVYDMRTKEEREAQPDRLPPGAELVVVDVLADAQGAAPAQLMRVLSDPAAAEQLLGGGKAVELFVHGYRDIVALPSALAAYRRFFSDVAGAENTPALFHCTTGKDRTGWAAAALLTLLEVPDDVVMEDFLLSSGYLLSSYQPVVDRFASIGGDPELLQPVIGVRPEYLEAARDEMRRRFGTIEGYFTEGLGLDAGVQAALRAGFVVRT
jgi:protein-tyrosine phosphatase